MKFQSPKELNLEKSILSKPEHLIFRRITVNGIRKFEKVTTKSKSLLKHLPYCYYIIDLIIERSELDKNTSYGYVNLRTELIDKVIPHTTRIQVFSLLEELGIIQINHKYSVGNFSKAYRLNPAYNINDLITIEYTDFEKGYHIVEPKDIQKGYYIVEPNNNKEVIEIDESLCSILFSKSNKIDSKQKKQKEAKTNDLLQFPEYQFQQNNIFNINLDYSAIERDCVKQNLSSLIEKISTGDNLTINVNNSVNRVFTPITNLKKEYRKYILCKDSKSLLEIDFKSSHLFHLLKEIIDCKPCIELLKEINSIKDTAISGDIYQYIADQLKDCNLDRSTAKKLFIESFLYGMYPDRKKSKAVCALFPLVSEYLKKKSRKQRSIDLQKSESHLLNNRIFKRIATECADATAYGIFDSILIDQNHFDQVYNIMKEESANYFGYDVPLTTKESDLIKKESEIVQRIGIEKARQLKDMPILDLMELVKLYSDSYDGQLKVIRDIRKI